MDFMNFVNGDYAETGVVQSEYAEGFPYLRVTLNNFEQMFSQAKRFKEQEGDVFFYGIIGLFISLGFCSCFLGNYLGEKMAEWGGVDIKEARQKGRSGRKGGKKRKKAKTKEFTK